MAVEVPPHDVVATAYGGNPLNGIDCCTCQRASRRRVAPAGIRGRDPRVAIRAQAMAWTTPGRTPLEESRTIPEMLPTCTKTVSGRYKSSRR